MANISGAFGHVEIQGKGAKNLAHLINETLGGEVACYYTEIQTNDPLEDREDYFYSTFLGCGRWTFQNNLGMFWDWIKDSVERSDDPKVKELFDQAKATDWEISFDFTDEECGLGVLYTMDYVIQHEAGDDCVNSQVADCKEYEYNVKNLVDLDVYENEEDAKESLGIE